MSFSPPLDVAFYNAIGVSDKVPQVFPVALAGHPYLIDLTQYRRSTIQTLRQPQDTGAEVGENSLNTEGLWSRSQSDWSLGSGQEYFDEEDSSRRRFSRSRGVDPWDRDVLSLLPEVALKRTSVNSNLRLITVGDRLFVGDGNNVAFSTDPAAASPTFTTITGTPAAAVVDMDTDGESLYVAYGTSNLYRVAAGGSAATALGTTATSRVGYTNGRLLAGHQRVISEVSAAGSYTTIFTHPLNGWTVKGFASSPANAYFFGDTGGRTSIYRIGVTENGTLTSAIFAGELPNGETLNELDYYGGIMLLATSKGVRIANIDGAGNLIVGPLIEISGGSSCVTADGQFIWFGWTSPYGDVAAGLGRADLGATDFPDGKPPYATDVMFDGSTGLTTAAATFGGRRYFAVAGAGVYGPTGNLVEDGWLESGRVRHSTLERKVGVSVDVGHEKLDGTVRMDVRDDVSNFEVAGLSDNQGSVRPPEPFAISGKAGEWIEVRMELWRGTVPTDGPRVRRWGLKVLPSPDRIDEIILPIVFRSKVLSQQGAGRIVHQALSDEYDFLRDLEGSSRVVSYQEGERSQSVYVDRIQMSSSSPTDLEWSDGNRLIEGVLLIRLLTV